MTRNSQFTLIFKWVIRGIFIFIYTFINSSNCLTNCLWLDSKPGPLVLQETTAWPFSFIHFLPNYDWRNKSEIIFCSLGNKGATWTGDASGWERTLNQLCQSSCTASCIWQLIHGHPFVQFKPTKATFDSFFLLLVVAKDQNHAASVTRFGEISPLRHNVKKLWPCWKGSFSVFRIFELTLANFICFGGFLMAVNGQILNKQSSHLVTLNAAIS